MFSVLSLLKSRSTYDLVINILYVSLWGFFSVQNGEENEWHKKEIFSSSYIRLIWMAESKLWHTSPSRYIASFHCWLLILLLKSMSVNIKSVDRICINLHNILIKHKVINLFYAIFWIYMTVIDFPQSDTRPTSVGQ